MEGYIYICYIYIGRVIYIIYKGIYLSYLLIMSTYISLLYIILYKNAIYILYRVDIYLYIYVFNMGR